MARGPRPRPRRRPGPGPGPRELPQLLSIRDTRTFLDAHRGLRRVRVEVRGADGVRAAARMVELLGACVKEGDWNVSYLQLLREAGDLHSPLCSARRALAKLKAKFGRPLICAVAEDDDDDDDAEAPGRRRHGARLQHGRRSARLQRGHRGALGDHLALFGVAFADGSAAASASADVDALRDAEDGFWWTKSAPLKARARALSSTMRQVRVLLRPVISRFASMESAWNKSLGRHSRDSRIGPFLAKFNSLQEDRAALVPLLRSLDRDLALFGSATINVA